MSTRTIDISLVLPCYNESGLFADSVTRIRRVLEQTTYSYEIIFVDDASSDGTQDHIRKTVSGRKHMRALFHPRNAGRGKTVADGIRAATGTVVGYIDIDCEISPIYIPQCVGCILSGEADVAIGKRFYRSSPGSLIREILSRGYRWLSDVLIGTGGLDTETGYKFFRRTKILPVLSKPRHDGWFWDTEIMVYAMRAGLSVREIPVLFLRRFDKHSSVNIIRDTWDYLINLFRLRTHLSEGDV